VMAAVEARDRQDTMTVERVDRHAVDRLIAEKRPRPSCK